MSNVDKKIEEMQAEIAKNNPAYKFNPLVGNHDADWLKDKANREKKAKENRAHKDQTIQEHLRLEREACQLMLNTPILMWWLENKLAPMSVMPVDKIELDVDPKTRRKQIEAMKIADLLDDILEKGSVNQ